MDAIEAQDELGVCRWGLGAPAVVRPSSELRGQTRSGLVIPNSEAFLPKNE
jgi:hypothetical protein